MADFADRLNPLMPMTTNLSNSRMVWPFDTFGSPQPEFPPVESADEYGAVLIGGELSTPWLLAAYRRGIFPWPSDELPQLLPWFSPDPRGILEFADLHISRRLRDTLRSGRFRTTLDADFGAVIAGCAQPRDDGVWITDEMVRAYTELHQLGHAHSLEVWQGDEIVGGVYGVAIGGYFSAESMFHRATDASKVALVGLVDHLRQRGYTLLDIQTLSDHTERMGGTEIPREEFLGRHRQAMELPVTFQSRSANP